LVELTDLQFALNEQFGAVRRVFTEQISQAAAPPDLRP
jgi:hypothetical protein